MQNNLPECHFMAEILNARKSRNVNGLSESSSLTRSPSYTSSSRSYVAIHVPGSKFPVAMEMEMKFLVFVRFASREYMGGDDTFDLGVPASGMSEHCLCLALGRPRP